MRTISKIYCHPLVVIILPLLLIGTFPAQPREEVLLDRNDELRPSSREQPGPGRRW